MTRVLVYMPDKLESFLAATAAVQCLCRSFEHQKLEYQLQIVCTNSTFSVFTPVFPNLASFSDGAEPRRGEFDFIARMSEEDAWEFGKLTEKHMASAMGQLIGADPAMGNPGVLPDLSKLDLKEPSSKLLYWMPDETLENDAVFALRSVSDYKMVVGVRGSFTYLAAALKKKVVEIYPTDRYKRWLSKWQNPNYQMIYDDKPPAEMILSAIKSVWEREELAWAASASEG